MHHDFFFTFKTVKDIFFSKSKLEKISVLKNNRFPLISLTLAKKKRRAQRLVVISYLF
jgi:hypothetical protein